MTPVIVLRIGAAMATAGFKPAAPVSLGNIFRVDYTTLMPRIFRVN
jgi:hypothetical protein